MQQNYTIDEAAEFLRIPVGTLRKHRPSIGGSKLGRRWVFTKEELTNFMKLNRSKPLQELQQ
ncbi:helix-turn-helix domain-containing protein [Sunxiuqinia sp. A32]|uniref:helix-turn-helix domain-containing protein n=1 Tax=Sunxiuqinia sp. A32 TaxID=3461496 RepID=UPI00404636BB